MKIIDRYLIKGFLAPFVVCVGIFSILVVLGRYFDKMDIFNNFHAHVRDIVVYLALGLPFWLNLVLPVATMVSLLFSLGALQQRGEWTALRTAGIASARLYAPYFAVGFLLSLFSLAGGLSFLPKLNSQMRAVYRVRIKRGQEYNYRKDHIVIAGSSHRRFTIGWLDVDNNLMKDVVVDRFDDNLDWIETLSAKEADYKDGSWVFLDGIWRRRDDAAPGGFTEEPFQQMQVPITEAPRDFILEDKMPEDMTGTEIIRRIRRLRSLGAPTDAERVALHMRIALPFANVMVIALAIPFAVKMGSRGRTQTFTYALALAFLYWGSISIAQSFGNHGQVPAWVAAWSANVVFSAVALARLRKAV